MGDPLTDEELEYVRSRCGRTTAATQEGYRSWLVGAIATIDDLRARLTGPPDGYCLKRPDGTLNVEYCFESREEAEHELGLESLHLGHGYAVVPVRVVECEGVEA